MKATVKDTKLKISVYVDTLGAIIYSASHHYDIWWLYKGRTSRRKYVDIMNKYIDFFHASLRAHFLALVVELYKLYETRRDTANFPQLLKLIADSSLADSSFNDQLKSKLLKIKPLWRKVAILRSELLAHTSIEWTPEAIFKKASIKPDEVKELLELSKDLLNVISKPLANSSHLFTLSAKDHTTLLLEDLLVFEKRRSNQALKRVASKKRRAP